MFKKNYDIYNFILILGTFLIIAAVYKKLPSEMAIHWNASGEIDGYASKIIAAFMAPSLMIFMWILMRVLPKIDPKKDNYLKFEKSYSVIISTMITMFFVLHVITISVGLGYKVEINEIVPIVIGLILIILGNYMPKMKSNFFCGIKTSWTLSSEVSWKKTHRLGGKLSVVSGILIILVTLLLDGAFQFSIVIVLTIISTIIPIIASYFYAKSDN